MPHSSVVLDDLSFAWPDGHGVLAHLSGAFTSGRTGLIGRNGTGKSTLLKLIAGTLTPTSGRVTVTGDVAMLAQGVTRDVTRTVSDLLGVTDVLAAVRAVESGDVAERHFDTIGADWDVEARAVAALADAGLPPEALDRTVGEISGGEAVLTAIAGLRLARPDVTLLDEPTNNLDRDARARLRGMIDAWPGTLIVVSHDVELLDRLDATAELHDDTLTVFGGPYSEWKAALAVEQNAAVQAEKAAASVLRREKRERIEAETKLAHRTRDAKKAVRDKRVPPIVAGGKKNAAEVSAGRLRTEARGKEEAARAAREAAEARIRDDEGIHIVLPDPEVSAGRRIATIGDGEREWILQGPERTAIVGGNGVGKTTLLHRLLGLRTPSWRDNLAVTAHTDRIGHLSQRLDGLDDALSAEGNLRASAPHLADRDARNLLAKFLIRGTAITRTVGTLSGGERFRVALACLLLAEPPAQLLVLDEPTNDVDLSTIDHLVDALADYRGAIIVTSHDDAFLRRLRLDRVLRLHADGTLTEEAPRTENP